MVVDLWGRCNDTVRVEHDFNHLEKLDGHLGWEWGEAMQAVSDTVLQPTLAPLAPEVRSFLFHGYDPGAVAARTECARRGRCMAQEDVRRDVCRQQLAALGAGPPIPRGLSAGARQGGAGVSGRLGLGQRPEWAVQKGIMGIDTDPAFLAAAGVEIRNGVRFDEVVRLLEQARFTPVFHRPLFRHFGIRDEPDVRDVLRRCHPGAHAAARVRRLDLWSGRAHAGSGRRPGRASD